MKQYRPLLKACVACMIIFWLVVLGNNYHIIRYLFYPYRIWPTLTDVFVSCAVAGVLFLVMQIKLLWKYPVVAIFVWLILPPLLIALVRSFYFDDVFVSGLHRNWSHGDYMGYGFGAAGISYALFLRNGPSTETPGSNPARV